MKSRKEKDTYRNIFDYGLVDKINLDYHIYRKIPDKGGSIFSFDTCVIRNYLDSFSYRDVFENKKLCLCMSPTVNAELRKFSKPNDFEDNVKPFKKSARTLTLSSPLRPKYSPCSLN